MTSRKNRGFSLLEMMIVIGIGLTVAGVSVMTLMPMLQETHVDQAYDTTLSVLRNYRNLSVSTSKRYIVTFTAPGTITVTRWDYATPVSPAPVFVASYTLPPDIQFAVQPGFPAAAPDGFGTGVAAMDFDQNVPPGGLNYVMFMPDGSSQDTLGNYNSGIVYVSRINDYYRSRALTVWGTTGRIRGWRVYLQSGVNKWVQQ
jgi:prepilin-type N-terminal cleavage/methylation domain-containing protein